MEDSCKPLTVEADWPPSSVKNLTAKLQIYFQSKKKSQGGDCVVQFCEQTRTASVLFRSAHTQDQVLAKQDHSVTIEHQLVKLKVFKHDDAKGLTEEPSGAAEAGSDVTASLVQPGVALSVRADNIPADADNSVDLLKMYFEKWGGPIEMISTITEEKAAIITFQSPDAVKRILDKTDHRISMVPISLRPYFDPDKSPSDTPEVPPASSSVLLENVPDSLSRTVLVILVENITGLSDGEFSLECIMESNIAVLTFKNPKVAQEFVMASKMNKMFQKYDLKARVLERSTSVKVENLPKQSSTDLLELYFEKWGGNVKEITMIQEEQAAIITFEKEEAINRILGRDHHIGKTQVKVYPYYQSLGTALYGKDRPTWALPKPFTEKIHPAVREFLHKKGLIPSICDQMGSLFCQVNMDKCEVQISPLPTLLRQKGITKNQIDDWNQNTADRLRNILSNYGVFEYEVNPSVWSTVEKDIRSVVKDKAFIKMDNQVLTLAGVAQDVKMLKPILEDVLQKASIQMERDKSSISDHMEMSPAMFTLLLLEGLQKMSLAKYPELKFTYKKDKNQLTFIGLPIEITDIKNVILEKKLSMKAKPLKLDPSLLDFLSSVDCDEMSEDLFTSKGINAVYKVENGDVVLTGSTDAALRDAEKSLQMILAFSTITLGDLDVIEKPEWRLLSDQLCNTFNTSKKKTVVIKASKHGGNIVISGFKEPVAEVSMKLDKFINMHSKIEEVIEVKSHIFIKFIQEKQPQALQKLEVKVQFDTERPLVRLSGERMHVQPVKENFLKIAEALHTDKLIIKKPGAKKYFQEQRSVFAMMIKEHKCVITLEEGHIVELVEEDLGAYGEDQEHQHDTNLLTETDQEDTDASTLNATAQEVWKDFNPKMSLLEQKSLEWSDDDELLDIDCLPGRQVHRANESVKFEAEELRQNSKQPSRTQSYDLDKSGALECLSTKGLRIILRKGNIQDESSDVIVNTIADDANLIRGAVSKALLEAAGPQLQTEAKVQMLFLKLSPGDILVTNGYKLNCQKVFHTVCPVWNGGAESEEEVMKQIITGCLKKAEQMEMASISFPAIGTGNLRFPRDLVSSIMLREIYDFSASFTPQFLNEVTVVVHPSDNETVQCFTKSFRHGKPSSNKNRAPGLFGVVSTPAPGVHTVQVGHVTLEVSSGDITKEETDAIVNSSNSSFSLKSGVSKAILDAAGSEVEMECALAAGLQQKDMILTSGGQLPCRHIIHIAGRNNPAGIKDVVTSVLNMCEAQKFSSVTFPALGTGQGNLSPSSVADVMIDGVVDFVSKKTGQHLRNVKFLIFQTSMMSDFHQSMLKRQPEGDEEGTGVFNWLKEKVVNYFSTNALEPPANEDLEIVPVPFEPAVFHLCAESQQDLSEACDLITSCIMKEQMSTTIQDSAINHFTKEDAEMLSNLQRELTVHIQLKKRGPEPVISVDGLIRDVFCAKSTIQQMINTVEKNKTRKREALMVKDFMKWDNEQ